MFENERMFWILVTAVIIILSIYCIARANIALDDSSERLEEAAQCMERQSKQIKDYRETVMLQEIKLNEKLAIAADLNLEPLGEFTLTHYSYSGLTYSETLVRENRTVAVDPDIIPLGSLLYIQGYGWRIAEDTGTDIKGNKLDIYIADEERAKQLGVKIAEVWIV